MSEKIHVLDSTAFYAGIPFQGEGKYYTTYQVLDEVRGRGIGAQLIHSRVQVTEPSKESVQKVKEASNRTGDQKSLSEADTSILAVTLDLDKVQARRRGRPGHRRLRSPERRRGHRDQPLRDLDTRRMEEDHLDNLLQGVRQGVPRPQAIRVRRLRDEAVEEAQAFKLTSISLLITGDFLARICWAGSSVVECLPRTQEVRGSNPLQSTIYRLILGSSTIQNLKFDSNAIKSLISEVQMVCTKVQAKPNFPHIHVSYRKTP